MDSAAQGTFAAGNSASHANASPDRWDAAYDHTTQAWYYYNLVTGERSWDPPSGWVPTGDAEGAAAELQAGGSSNPANDYSYNVPLAGPSGGPGYYYTDAHGINQGPFTKEQLVAWRGSLPMDLQVWYIQPTEEDADKENGTLDKEEERKKKDSLELKKYLEDNVHEKEGLAAPELVEGAAEEAEGVRAPSQAHKEAEAAESVEGLEGAKVREQATETAQRDDGTTTTDAEAAMLPETSNADDNKRKPYETVDLADILGDTKLLAQWREEHPEAVGASCAAPTAVAYEQDQAKDSYTSLAEAVVAGLPRNDEAVQLAWAAASAGQSLHSVVEWSRQQGEIDYTATALHAGKVGRVQAATGERESLYADMGSWIDPRKMEEQLEKAKNREKRKLTAQEVRAVRQRKQEMKEKKLKAWLLE